MSAADASAPQRVAADPGYSAWVTANAGSGKTKVLIDRVARLLLGRAVDSERVPDPSKILCLTYTRAAAANMQNKLFARLGGWALMDDAALREALTELDPVRGDGIDLKRARRLFAQALETPGGLKIQTIHAFCESLLRRFPLEAEISPHFKLMDEPETAALMAEAKDRAIFRALTGGNGALRDAAERIIDRVQEFGIDPLIGQIVSAREAFRGNIGAITARIAAALGVDENATIESARAAFLEGFDLDDLRTLANAFAGGGKHEQAAAPALLAALAEGTPDDQIDALRFAVLTAAGGPRKAVPTKAIKDAHAWAEAFVDDLKDALIAMVDRERAIEAFANSKALAWFAITLLKEVRALKQAQDAVDFDDLIRLASKLLTKAEARDWVRYKLDGGVDHILVDEAQDTSAEQWEVIGAIAEEFFSGDGARPDVHRTLFVVGDEKQSIYSFQGADPRGLSVVKERFDELTSGVGAPMQEPELLHSFRSTPAVLTAVDTVFAAERAADGLSADGAAPVHLAFRENRPGRVEYWPSVEPREAAEERPWYEPVDMPEPDAPHLRLAEAIASRIGDWLDTGTILPSRGRPIRAGDVLILVRRRNAFADAMIRKLKDKGIPVAGEDRMVLTQQLAVRDLMALARFALLPDDDLTLATVLRSPIIGLSEAALFTLAHERPKARRLWWALQERKDEPDFADAFAVLNDLLNEADFLRPFEFLDRALSHHGARARFLGRLGVQAEDPIDELLGQALSFEAMEVPTLQAFVERIDSTEFQVKREMEQGRDEVRVMTAHGAKGLEANIVFLPDTVALPPNRSTGLFTLDTPLGKAPVWSRRTGDDPAPISALRTSRKEDDLKEYRRLLYVGMTRAQDWLIVCGYRGRNKASDDSWLRLVEDGFADAPDCATPLLDEAGDLVMGRVIETDGDERDTDEGGGEAVRTEVPIDPALMTSAKESSNAAVSPSRLMEEDPTDPPPLSAESEDQPEPVSSAERGTLMHGLLERLAPLDAAMREDEGARGLAEADRPALEAVLAILDAPDFAWMFGADSLPEVKIAGPVAALDGLAVSGAIDRLVIRDGAIDIVDFKSGARHDPMPEGYLRQLALYTATLREIYPDHAVRAHLLWLDAQRLDTPDTGALDAALSRAAHDLEKRG